MLGAGDTLGRKSAWRWEERGGLRQGDSPPVSWARETRLLGLAQVLASSPSEGASLRQLQDVALPRKTFSSQAAEQPPALALVPHPC